MSQMSQMSQMSLSLSLSLSLSVNPPCSIGDFPSCLKMVTNISTSEFTTTSSTRMASPCTLAAEPQFSITTRQSPLGFGKVFVFWPEKGYTVHTYSKALSGSPKVWQKGFKQRRYQHLTRSLSHARSDHHHHHHHHHHYQHLTRGLAHAWSELFLIVISAL